MFTLPLISPDWDLAIWADSTRLGKQMSGMEKPRLPEKLMILSAQFLTRRFITSLTLLPFIAGGLLCYGGSRFSDVSGAVIIFNMAFLLG
jgi:hypothetical protein